MWRSMCQYDIKKVHEISLAPWGEEYYESIEMFQDKYNFYPNGCFVYEKENKVQGYVISHPWSKNIIPKLNKLLDIVDINTYYIHDIVIVPELRGNHLADEIIQNILKNKRSVCLVAISYGIQQYWEKFGFKKTKIRCDHGVHMQKN